uniref:Uncharacterized protein n=1 Tax=Megaselia scalaris TaxID=36166 RepID=T1GLR8_MEGSC
MTEILASYSYACYPDIANCGRHRFIGKTKLDAESIFLEIEKVASSYGLRDNGIRPSTCSQAEER